MENVLSKKLRTIAYITGCGAFIGAIIGTVISYFVFPMHNWLLQGIIILACQLIITPFFFLIWKKNLFDEEIK